MTTKHGTWMNGYDLLLLAMGVAGYSSSPEKPAVPLRWRRQV